MPDVPSQLPPAGWFTDPKDRSQLRLWDGMAWSEFFQPTPVQSPPSRPVTQSVAIKPAAKSTACDCEVCHPRPSAVPDIRQTQTARGIGIAILPRMRIVVMPELEKGIRNSQSRLVAARPRTAKSVAHAGPVAPSGTHP